LIILEGGERAMKWLAKFIKEDSGATAVEYGITVAAIAAVIIGVVILVGTKVNTAFNTVDTSMNHFDLPQLYVSPLK
jgi:pilus assembly protein Flp/PilA